MRCGRSIDPLSPRRPTDGISLTMRTITRMQSCIGSSAIRRGSAAPKVSSFVRLSGTIFKSVTVTVALTSAALAADLRVAPFSCDVTPPIGHPLCGGTIKPLEAIDEPLLAKGILVSDGKDRYVICAVDWCLLQTGAYEMFRQKLASAADTPPSHVAVQTVHQ